MHFVNVTLAALLCYSYYTSLHPLLRVAVKNLVLVD